jgi:hypothetical protein
MGLFPRPTKHYLNAELPMIYTSTFITWIVADISPLTASKPNRRLPLLLLLFNIAFTLAYLYYPKHLLILSLFGHNQS